MATQVLSVGSTETASEDFTVTNAETVSLFSAERGAKAKIQYKDSSGGYKTVAILTYSTPIQVIAGPGTYRVKRFDGATCGVCRG